MSRKRFRVRECRCAGARHDGEKSEGWAKGEGEEKLKMLESGRGGEEKALLTVLVMESSDSERLRLSSMMTDRDGKM